MMEPYSGGGDNSLNANFHPLLVQLVQVTNFKTYMYHDDSPFRIRTYYGFVFCIFQA